MEILLNDAEENFNMITYLYSLKPGKSQSSFGIW